jgi:hypothetical protein
MENVIEAGDHFVFGHAMGRVGDCTSAILHLERSMEIWRKSLGDGHENTLWATGALAKCHEVIGSFQKAS